MLAHIDWFYVFLYCAIGFAFAEAAMARALDGNIQAPRLVHFQIGLIGALFFLFWPVAVPVYLAFLLAIKTAKAWKMRKM